MKASRSSQNPSLVTRPAEILPNESKGGTLSRNPGENKIDPLPGVTEWLNRLRGRDARSPAPPPANIDTVFRLSLKDVFQAVVASEDVATKPDPAVFNRRKHLHLEQQAGL
jgi:FMN phosphatase YigB (HAD superfamily)